jgi:DNA-binding NtrC family response regulator
MDKVIVCVDDEAILLLSLKRELKNAFGPRFVYETARDAAEALALIEELLAEGRPVVLVISDWYMPGIKGDAFVRELWRRHPSIRTIMVTGQADETKMAELKAENPLHALIRKPWRHEELIAAVASCVDAEGPGASV